MRRLVLALALLAAACSAETVTPFTTTTLAVEEPSTTTTAVAESTTTTRQAVVDICRRGLVWEPGTTYAADCFAVPVSFEVSHEGWGSAAAGSDWVRVRWQGEDRGLQVRVAVVEFRAASPPEVVLDWIAGVERISEVSTREDVMVAGLPGLAADFEGAPEPVGDTMPDPCTGDSPVWFGGTSFGHPLLSTSGPDVIGVGACDIARIWVLEVDGRTVTILGGTADPDRHDEAVAKIEELFEGMSFDVGAGS